MLLLVVGDEALEIADAEGLAALAEQASAFAVILLRADAAGDGGEDVIFANFGGGGEEVAVDDELDEILDLDADGAILGAGGLGAFEAAQGFLAREFG